MPDLTASAATLRAGGYHYRGYVSIVPQTVVFSRAVNMASITYPLTALTYDNPYGGGGAFGDVAEGMTIRVYDQNQTDVKHILRVAAGGADATTIQINEISGGTLNISDNDRFDVINEFRIWDKLVAANATLDKDTRIAFTDQGAKQAPIVNSGGPYPAFISGSTISVNFFGSASQLVDPDSASGITHAWDFVDGTPASSASADPSGVTFPAGFRMVKHTITDVANGKTSVQYVRVWAHDNGANAPLDVEMANLSYREDTGWEADFRLPIGNQADISTLPDGAPITYWEREYYDGVEQSFGSDVSGRSHIKFDGFLVSESIRINPDEKVVEFRAIGPLGMLKRTPALPQFVENATSATNWQQIEGLTTNVMLWYLFNWHTTLNTVTDVIIRSTIDNVSLTGITVTSPNNVADQFRDIMQSIRGMVTCDRLGRIIFDVDPEMIQNETARGLRTTAYNFTEDDFMTLDIPREHLGRVKLVRGEGIDSNGKPVLSNAPGSAPAWFGTATEILSRQLVETQNDLNNYTGWYFAKLNGIDWRWSGGNALHFMPRGVSLTLPDGYDVFDPALLDYVGIETGAVAADPNKRGIEFQSGQEWLIKTANVSYDMETGGKQITLTCDFAAYGFAGETFIPPDANLPASATTPNPLITTTTIPAALLPAGQARIMLWDSTNNKLYITSNFNTPNASGGPNYSVIDLTAITNWDGNLVDVVQDAFQTDNFWIATTTKLLYMTNASSASRALVVKHTFNATVVKTTEQSWRAIETNRAAQNHVVCVSYYANHATFPGTWATWSTDNSTFTETQITAQYQSNATTGIAATCFVSPVNPLKVYAFAFTTTGSGIAAVAKLHVSTNGGSSWGISSNPAITVNKTPGQNIHVPFAGSESTVYYTDDNTLPGEFQRSNTDITPDDGTNFYAARDHRGFDTYPGNENIAALAGLDNSAGLLTALWTTLNAKASPPIWTKRTSDIAFTTNGAIYRVALSGNNSNVLYAYGLATVKYSSDFGVTLDERKGDIPSPGELVLLNGW